MDRDAIQQILTQRVAELDEVEKRLESVRVDMQKQRLLSEEVKLLRSALNGSIEPSAEESVKTRPAAEKHIDAVRRVLKASLEPMTAPVIAERLCKEGRQFRANDKKGTNTVRGLLVGYGETAPAHRQYFRRLEMEDGTYYESLEKD